MNIQYVRSIETFFCLDIPAGNKAWGLSLKKIEDAKALAKKVADDEKAAAKKKAADDKAKKVADDKAAAAAAKKDGK